MAKPNPIGLQVTKGSFQVRGIVRGTDKDFFYKELTTKTNKPMRMINFGIEYNTGKFLYVHLNGMEKDKVYFSRAITKNGEKTSETINIPWSERFNFHDENCRMMGVNLGIVKTVDSKGDMVNDKQTMTEYDACKYIADNLEEKASVFIKGKIEFSTYNGKQKTNFVPTQISLCKPVDFDATNFKETASFDQTIILMGVNKISDKQHSVSAKVVDYNSLENTELIVEDPLFVKTLKTLKPYTSVKLFGEIRARKDTVEVKSSNGYWGAANPMEQVNNQTVWELVVTGGDDSSVDTTLYNEKSVNAALDKLKADESIAHDFGAKKDEQQGSWGVNPSGNTDSGDDDEDDPWQ